MKVFIVLGFFKEVVESLEICEDKETADNYSLDYEEKGLKVARFEREIKNMKKYNKDN